MRSTVVLALMRSEQSFESRNVHLTARLFTCLAESFVGIAGFNCSSGSAEQSRSMRAGETCAERAGESKSEDTWQYSPSVPDLSSSIRET